MKADFLFVGLNLNIVVQERNRQTNAHFVDDVLKTRRKYKYSNVETQLLFPSSPSKFLAAHL